MPVDRFINMQICCISINVINVQKFWNGNERAKKIIELALCKGVVDRSMCKEIDKAIIVKGCCRSIIVQDN